MPRFLMVRFAKSIYSCFEPTRSYADGCHAKGSRDICRQLIRNGGVGGT